MKKTIAFVILTLLLTGCVSHRGQTRRRSELMAYLYPNRNESPSPHPEQARMQLPLRLGIAFVPTSDYNPPVSPPDEKRLLETVRKAFHGRDWIREIVIIPSSYLVAKGGFDNLDQVSKMYGVDVIALASVDQIQHVDAGKLSFLFVSVIASYVLPLERNDTNTLIDVAVFHVPTRTFLLRAPGVSRLKGRSSIIEEPRRLREKAALGLKDATDDLAKNLNLEVESFKASIVAGARPEIDIINERGVAIRSSGAVGLTEAILAALFALLVWRVRS